MTINVDQIDKINEQLEGLTSYVDNYVLDFEGKSQEYINLKMEDLNIYIEEKLNKIKDEKIVPPIKSKYAGALYMIELLAPLAELSLSADPTVLLDAIEKIIASIIGPYQPALDYIIAIVPKITELNNNIQTLATYQPTVTGATIPPLDIDISLSMDDILP